MREVHGGTEADCSLGGAGHAEVSVPEVLGTSIHVVLLFWLMLASRDGENELLKLRTQIKGSLGLSTTVVFISRAFRLDHCSLFCFTRHLLQFFRKDSDT